MKLLKLSSQCTLFLLLLLASSCGKQLPQGIDESSDAQVNLNITAPLGVDGTSDENMIEKLRIVIFKTADGSQYLNQLVNKADIAAALSGGKYTFKSSVPRNTELEILMVVNERSSYILGNTSKTKNEMLLDNINYYSDDKRALVFGAPIVMHALSTPASFAINSDVNLQLRRNIAKVALKLKFDPATAPGFDAADKLVPEKAVLYRLASPSHLETINCSCNSDDEHAIGEEVKFVENVNYTIGSDNKFTTTGDGLTLYASEHVVVNKKIYSYAKIFCRYYPKGVAPGIEMTYVVPIGNGVQRLWDAGSSATVDDLTGEELTITRNNIYDIDATINNKGEANGVVVTVGVKPWELKDANSDILSPSINLSEISGHVTNIIGKRIYFWTDQPINKIRVETTATDELGNVVNTNDYFQDLANSEGSAHAENLVLIPGTTNAGYLDVKVKRNMVASSHKLTIKLIAGSVTRSIPLSVDIITLVDWSKNPYVGAFYRSHELGERIIMGENTGAWSAEITDGDDFIVLSSSPSPDPNLCTASPRDAEEYPITDGVKKLSGEGRIFFRIGLLSKNTAGSEGAPRYGRIKVSNISLGDRYIYVRQGEAADYVMRKTDLCSDGSAWSGDNVNPRPNAEKIAAFNLTVSHPTNTSPFFGEVGKNGASFTSYPSQAGYYFQSSGNTMAYHPSFEPTTPVAGFAAPSPLPGWSDIYESCPNGYHRIDMSDGVNSGTYPDVTKTAITHSLFYYSAHGSSGEYNSGDNMQIGRYADGFYDRHEFSNADVSAASPNGPNRFIVGKDAEIAFSGALIYNPLNNASVFFPISGGRSGNGTVSRSKLHMWSRSNDSTDKIGYSFSLDSNAATLGISQQKGLSEGAYPIRCVKNN